MRDSRHSICRRLRQIREDHYGTRGRARFARDLGISATTYGQYESLRVPPADLLWRAARLTKTRIEWLIAGEGERDVIPTSPADGLASRLGGTLTRLLVARPDLFREAETMLDMLRKLADTSSERPGAAPRVVRPAASELIPIVGSTSAGTARYWDQFPHTASGPEADARLERLLARCFTASTLVASALDLSDGRQISLVQLSEPDEHGLLEFVSAADLRQRFPRSVAWRIDGDSMSPRYDDGDLVFTSPDAPAADGQPSVIRQRGQLGVSCKLLRRESGESWLIPVNPRYAPQRVANSKIEWALRVVAAVRLQRFAAAR